MFFKYSKYILWLAYAYFSYLLFLITVQYIPLNFDVAFLRIKQDEIQLFHYKIAFFTHVYTSIFLIAFGWIQFSSFIRKKYSKLHRNFGKLYIVIILLFSGPSGLIMSYYANGGIISQIAFIILSVLWLLFTYLSFYYVRRLDFINHQKFAIRSFALTLSAISLRLFKFIIVFLFQPFPMNTYRIVSWLGWTFNLVLAEIIIVYFLNKRINGIKTN
ncbi:DUF2306 domain-containing protein [Flavobacterium ponti]|jgi:uncharacterized membrane protein|uniref:DUF2306 domain-containing protein n=1 Tax=Flavobacterium ponti TaxID=665133 RepID=A0ABV9P5N2_9FLAO